MKLRPFIPALLIAAVGVVAYHNSFHGPFIYDDLDNILENPTIRHLWPISQPLSPPVASYVGGRPITNLSLALNYAAGGTDVWGYHAVNLLVHVLAALALYGIVRRTFARPALRQSFHATAEAIALAVALIWAVHPLQTEAVTYISQRCESLMGLFYLLTLYAFIRGAESQKPFDWFCLSVTACFLGMACKEVMVTAPVMVLLYDRTFVSGTFQLAWTRHRRLYLGLASSWLLLGWLMLGLHHRSVGFGLGCTWWGYALTECPAIILYLRAALWPNALVFDYGPFMPPADWFSAAPYALVVALLLAVALVQLRRRPALGFIGAWFFLILAPTSSLVPVMGSPTAEHRMYLPLASLVTLVVVGTLEIGKRLLHRQQALVWGCVASGSVALLFTGLTIRRNRDYQSDLSICQDTVKKCPNNARAHGGLGLALVRLGRVQEAIDQYEQALRLNPGFAMVHYNLGRALARQGNMPEAIVHWEQALRIQPEYAEAHNNLGVALMRQGRLPEAINHYHQALQLKPDYADAHSNLGLALQFSGDVPHAIEQYRQALQIDPLSPVARQQLDRLGALPSR